MSLVIAHSRLPIIVSDSDQNEDVNVHLLLGGRGRDVIHANVRQIKQGLVWYLVQLLLLFNNHKFLPLLLLSPLLLLPLHTLLYNT